MITWRAVIGALLTLVLYAAESRADFPERTIRLVVPFAPGGANDSVARLVSDKLTKILGQSVVVENRPGGGTVIGTASVAAAAPDGYTLLLISPAHTINPYINKSLPYQTLTDFTPISQVTRSAYVLVTSSKSPFKTIHDFTNSAQHPSIAFASAGPGSAPHLAGQLFVTLLGVKAVHVPYQGGAPAMVGVIRGDVDMYFSSIAGARSFVDSRQVRALAVSSSRRVKAMPEVPTVAEAGVAGFAIDGWYGFIGPAHMPARVTSRLSNAIEKALNDPDLISRLQQEGEEVAGGTPEQFDALLRSDYEKYRTIAASIAPQSK
jgi:tripartite-type tricarboxylate transporter receptor subunit TctC